MKWSRIVCAIGAVAVALLWLDGPRGRAGRHHRRRSPASSRTRRAPSSRAPPSSPCTSRRARPTKRSRRPTDDSSSPACASAVPTRSRRRCPGSRRRRRTTSTLNLGVTQDLDFTLKVANVAETITVVGQSDPVFSSGRTGAATAVHARGSRDAADDFRPHHRHHAPDAAVRRQRHVRRPGQPREQHDGRRLRTSTTRSASASRPAASATAPASRRSRSKRSSRCRSASRRTTCARAASPAPASTPSRAAAPTSSPPRSTTARATRSVRLANVERAPASSARQPRARFNPNFKTTTGRVGRRPDRQEQAVRVRRLREAGRHAPADDVHVESGRRAGRRQHDPRATRRISTALSSFLSTNFNYDTGPFDNIQKMTPAKPWMLKGDYNVNSANKVTFRYNQLDSSSPTSRRTDRRRSARQPADQHDATS